jgi:hypothetical protein
MGLPHPIVDETGMRCHLVCLKPTLAQMFVVRRLTRFFSIDLRLWSPHVSEGQAEDNLAGMSEPSGSCQRIEFPALESVLSRGALIRRPRSSTSLFPLKALILESRHVQVAGKKNMSTFIQSSGPTCVPLFPRADLYRSLAHRE